MKKELKGFIIGFTACALLSSTVLADSIGKSITAVYNNIKIYVDGNQIQPKDANGKVVEPFIYNGTTYLPIRAIATAIGKEVEWDAKSNSVYLGKKTNADSTNSSEILNDYISITKEGFARKISTLTSKPIEKTTVFNPDDTIYYVFKIDSLSTDFDLKFSVKYEDEDEVVLIDNYTFNKEEVEGLYAHVNMTLPEGVKLPVGSYTYKIQGYKDSEVLFEIVDTCEVK